MGLLKIMEYVKILDKHTSVPLIHILMELIVNAKNIIIQSITNV